jgi:chromosome segregation ATPase
MEKEQLNVSTRSTLESWMFDSLERDFQEVLIELEADRNFDRFRKEYEKLHRALRKSHESEKRLIKKCRELNGEIQKNAKKVSNSLKLNEEDSKTINTLKAEIDKAWKMVDASQEKEAKAKDSILALEKELVNLDVVVDQGATITCHDAQVVDMEKEKEKTMRQIEMLKVYIENLKKEIEDWQEKAKQAETRYVEIELELEGIKDLLASKRSECEREIKKKERIDKDLKVIKAELTFKDIELKNQIIQSDEKQDQILHLNDSIQEAKIIVEKASKELQLMNLQMEKLNIEMEEQISTNTQLLTENSQRLVELKLKEEEIEKQTEETLRISKLHEAALHKVKSFEYAQEDSKKEYNFLIDQKLKVEKDLDDQKRIIEQQKQRIDEIAREKDMITKSKTQVDLEIKKQMDAIKVGQVALKNLEIEIDVYKHASLKQDEEMKVLEKKNLKHSIKASTALSKYNHVLNLVKNNETKIIDLQKKLEDSHTILRQQQNINEAIRSERNVYSKNLVTAQDEIREMKRKFKVMNHLVEQLKEELNLKDVALIKEHFDLQKIEKEREILKGELSKNTFKIKSAEAAIVEHLNQIVELNCIISQDHDNMLKLKKELEACKFDRDSLGAQLIKKKNETNLVYEKMKIQTATLSKGQAQYKDRLQETRILKIKITTLKRDHLILSHNVKNIVILRKEIFSLSKELSLEKIKVRALSEELENPLNVHRWRKLEGSDPQAYEMILKIQTLQKRLILKTEETIEKDILIQEKEKLYIELCNILARQPGPEVFHQVVSYARSLNKKTQQMKAMASELNMLHVILFYLSNIQF